MNQTPALQRIRAIIVVMAVVAAVFLPGCRSNSPGVSAVKTPRMERVVIAADQRGFVFAGSRRPFVPWGLNYGNAGRLMEDFWDGEWKTFASDFREMKAMGANVVRVHLQFGRFMEGPSTPNPAMMRKLDEMLALAEETGLYLDITGLACYRKADVPSWYDALDETQRWAAQARFWRAVAARCARSPAVFCYDLMNEPISPGQRRAAGDWYSGKTLGSYDFIQFITLDPAGRRREEVAVLWLRQMTRAIREEDGATPITVGLLPWVQGWRHLSGFIPAEVAPHVDFLSVHIYPDTKKPDEAREALRLCRAGKPVVIEETFPLSCSAAELETFLRESRGIACGWVGHYDGATIAELDARQRAGSLTIQEAMWREWLRLFVRLRPEFTNMAKGPDKTP
jgi:hypothetical protein